MKRARIVMAAAALAAAAAATQIWTEEEMARPFGPPVAPRVGYSLAAGQYDPHEVYENGIAFVARWQVTDPNDPNYGGIIEGEDLTNVIQTDNTQESVWDWSRWRDMTGSREYDDYVARSWIYILNFPAWLEEGWGSESQKYYRIYNCGWGMRAEMMYRHVTGDTSHQDYGLTCAQFVADNAINITLYPANFYCTAWAVGNLYEYAEDVGDAALKASALALAEQVKALAEEAPATRIGSYSWAMSGGATVWGLHESYFREHPGEEAAWMAQYAPYMPELVPAGSNTWDNAWNAWFMLGYYAAYHATGDAAYWTRFDNIAGNLVAQDTDDDGGIPASQAGTSDADQSWVTSYMCYMGMDRILRDLGVKDLAAEPRPGEVRVSWAAEFEYHAANYNVYREEVGVPGRPKVNSQPIGGPSPYEFADPHVAVGHKYRYWVEAEGATGFSRTFGPAEVTAGGFPLSFGLSQNYPNPFSTHTTVDIALAEGGEADLSIYDLAGREVWRRDDNYGAGKHAVEIDADLPAGVYLCQLKVGEEAAVRRMVVVK